MTLKRCFCTPGPCTILFEHSKTKSKYELTDNNYGMENASAPDKKELYKIQSQKNKSQEKNLKEIEKEINKNANLLTNQLNQAIKPGISLINSHLYIYYIKFYKFCHFNIFFN